MSALAGTAPAGVSRRAALAATGAARGRCCARRWPSGSVLVGSLSEALSAYHDLQLAQGAYYFAALAGLTVLTGLTGRSRSATAR